MKRGAWQAMVYFVIKPFRGHHPVDFILQICKPVKNVEAKLRKRQETGGWQAA